MCQYKLDSLKEFPKYALGLVVRFVIWADIRIFILNANFET